MRQYREHVVQPTGQGGNAEEFHAGRRKFDGERYSIQAAADLGDGRGGRVIERESVDARARALNEQLDGGIGFGLAGGDVGLDGRTFERRETMHALPRDPQRLAARDENVGFDGFPKDPVGQSGDGLDDLLTVVEHDQNPLIA